MIYLMHNMEDERYYIINATKDFINDIVNDGNDCIIYYEKPDQNSATNNSTQSSKRLTRNTECLYKAKDITNLLLAIQKAKDYRWYVVLDHIDSNGKTRQDEYPIHCGLQKLVGYIPSVCRFRIDNSPYFADWQVDYISELWIKNTESSIVKVANFTETRNKEVAQFMNTHNLQPQYTE